MLLGGWRALRQHDLKLLLAYGTVSQLGFLMVVARLGTRAAALAGLAMLLAHALFKATLFLVVGIIDHQAGTRDLRELSGRRPVDARCWRRSRSLAGASMAGLPPLVGFVAKESVFGALIDVARHGDGTGLGRLAGWPCSSAWSSARRSPSPTRPASSGARSPTKPGTARTDVRPHRGRLPGRPGAARGVPRWSLGFAGRAGDDAARRRTPTSFPAGRARRRAGAVARARPAAGALGRLAGRRPAAVPGARRRSPALQAALAGRGAPSAAYRRSMRLLDRLAVEVTGLTQRGSLPFYLGVILLGRRAAARRGAADRRGRRPDERRRSGTTRRRLVVGGDHRGRRGAHRPVPAPAARRWSWSVSPATARRCCSSCTAPRTWR